MKVHSTLSGGRATLDMLDGMALSGLSPNPPKR